MLICFIHFFGKGIRRGIPIFFSPELMKLFSDICGHKQKSSAMIWCGILLVLLLNARATSSNSPYLIGLGSHDITGPAADVNMMGYANMEQIASGVHFRLRARTFIVAEPEGDRVVFVNLDACMASQLVKMKVIERLRIR